MPTRARPRSNQPSATSRAAPMLAAPLLLALASGIASAQPTASADTSDGAVPTPPPGQRDLLGKGRMTLRANTTFSLNADLDGEGDSSVGRLGAGASYAAPLTDSVFANFSYDVEFSFYDFGGATGLTADGDPVDSVYEHTLSVGFNGRINPAWGWFAGGGVKIAAETGANDNGIYQPIGFGGVSYRFSDSLTMGFGLGVAARLEDNARILPLIQVDWRIDEQWRLSAGRTIITEGPTAALFYKANENTELFVGGGLNFREFRMDDEGPVPDGVFNDNRVPILAGVDWAATPNIRLIAGGGVTAWQEYQIDDSSGNEVSSAESDPSGMLFLRLEASF